MIPPLPHPPSHTKKSRVDKVSVTLRIPTELKEWADAFARDADLDISGLFIQSLRETQRRGEILIAPPGYQVEHLQELDFSPEAWKGIQETIGDTEEKYARGEIRGYDTPRELHNAILGHTYF